ncbi:hypothetical protein [Dongia sp.]|uniref:hypothetical protein n=1 Tax=Dongia sp. TaxID=1977262 RepID=UPI00374FE970
MLFVRPAPEVQREVYRVEGVPHWSAGFGQILEKHGFVAFDEADHHILEDADRLAGYELAIVSWMPERFWTAAMVTGLSGFAGAVILEGPVPTALRAFAGFEVIEEGSLDRPVMTFPDPEIAAEITEGFLRVRPASNATLAEKNVKTRQSRLNRWDYDFDPERMGLQDWARRIARLMRLTVINRLMKDQFSANLEDCLFAAANLLLFLKKGGQLSEPDRAALVDFVAALRVRVDQAPHPLIFGRKRHDDTHRLSAAVAKLAGQVGLPLSPGRDTPDLGSRNLTKAERLGLALLEQEAGIPGAQSAGLSRGSALDPRHWGLSPKSSMVLDIAISSWASRISGAREAADEMLLEIVRDALDPETGRLRSTLTRSGHSAPAGSSATTHPLIGLAFMSALASPAEAPPLGESFALRYGDARLAKWSRLGLEIQRVKSVRERTDVLLGLEAESSAAGDAQRYVGGCHRANVIAYSFPILATIVSYHHFEPLAAPFTDCDSSTAILLEPVFFLALERLAAATAAPLLRVEPWPAGKQYCLTIRHDVDRLPTTEHLASLMAFEKSRGLGVTWFWIFNRLDPDQIHLQERAGHEIALHSMKVDDKSSELKRLAATLSIQSGIYGECQHGGGGGDYWLGHPNVETSHESGLLYSESNSCLYDFPHRWSWVDDQGCLRFYDIICMSHDLSVDRPRPSPEHTGWNSPRLKCMVRNSGHIMVLNHPDAFLDRLMEIVDEELPAEGRLDWNCRQVAEWWRATHCREHVGARLGATGVELRPRCPAESVVISIAGLKEEGRLPATFCEIEGRTTRVGLHYRRFVVNLVPASGEVGHQMHRVDPSGRNGVLEATVE